MDIPETGKLTVNIVRLRGFRPKSSRLSSIYLDTNMVQFLGVFEGGLFPGVNYYITQW